MLLFKPLDLLISFANAMAPSHSVWLLAEPVSCVWYIEDCVLLFALNPIILDHASINTGILAFNVE